VKKKSLILYNCMINLSFSFFGTYELPSMNKMGKITSLTVIALVPFGESKARSVYKQPQGKREVFYFLQNNFDVVIYLNFRILEFCFRS